MRVTPHQIRAIRRARRALDIAEQAVEDARRRVAVDADHEFLSAFLPPIHTYNIPPATVLEYRRAKAAYNETLSDAVTTARV